MKSRWIDLVLGLSAAILIVVIGAPWSSDHPDTLERTIEHLQPGAPPEASIPAPLADYEVPGLASPWWSRVLAGVAGVLGVVLLVRIVLRPTRRDTRDAEAPVGGGAARKD